MKPGSTLYPISGWHIFFGSIMIAGMTAVAMLFVYSALSKADQPTVFVDPEGRCIKVVNYRNGDSFACQDKDVVLRKYNIEKAPQ